MRFLFTCFLLVWSFSIYSQGPIDFKGLDTLQIHALAKQIAQIPTESDSLVVSTPDIKAEHWNTKIYNPFKEVLVQYPIKLTFEDTTYSSPMSIEKKVTSRYGWRRGRPHKAIDIDLVTGDSLFAMFDGIVRFAKYNTGHGKTVIVRHYNGLETVYAHLSKYGVKENDSVFKGQYLGKGGATGNARGSHLHLEINYQGVAIHPEYLFEFNKDNKIRAKEIWVTTKWTRPSAHNSRRISKIKPLLSSYFIKKQC